MNEQKKKLVEVAVSTDDGQSPHLATMQCPSPKKGLAHAIVQCHIHLGRIADPRILPCGHSFCFRCLRTLHQKQQQSAPVNNQKLSTNSLAIVCPLCRRENHIESIDALTTNYAVTDLLEIFDAEEKEEERIKRETVAEVEHTVHILRCLQKKCTNYSTLAQNRLFADSLQDAIITTEKRISYLGILLREMEEEKDRDAKERLIKKVYYTCLAYQRLAEMLDGEIELANGKANRVRQEVNDNFFGMYKNTVVLEYRPTEAMAERRARVWFSIIFSLIRRCWMELDKCRFTTAASILAMEFSKHFDESDGTWIAVTGRRPLGCWIWKDEQDYACLDISDYRMAVYRRNLQRKQDLVNGDTTQDADYLNQSFLDTLLKEAVHTKEKAGCKDLNVAMFVRERLQREHSGHFWHVVAGYKDTFGVRAAENGQAVQLDARTSQAKKWAAVVLDG